MLRSNRESSAGKHFLLNNVSSEEKDCFPTIKSIDGSEEIAYYLLNISPSNGSVQKC